MRQQIILLQCSVPSEDEGHDIQIPSQGTEQKESTVFSLASSKYVALEQNLHLLPGYGAVLHPIPLLQHFPMP